MKDIGHTAVLESKSGQSTSGKNFVSSKTLEHAKVDIWAISPTTVRILGLKRHILPLLARNLTLDNGSS